MTTNEVIDAKSSGEGGHNREVGHPIATAARWLLVVAGALATLPVVATLLLRQITVDRPWAVAYVAASPFVVAAGIGAVVLFLLARTWAGVATAGVVTVILLLTQAPLYLGTSTPEGRKLTVMTVNIYKGLADAQMIADVVRSHGIDVLTVQELTPGAVEALAAAGLDDLLPYSSTRPAAGADGNGLWSRFPLEGHTERKGFDHPPVSASMDLDGSTLFVASVHPTSPYPDDTARWSRELGELADWLGGVEAPAIIGGDFNATHDHRQFRDVLATGFRDAAEQAGSGFLPTYLANRRRLPPLITIDHVISGGGIVAIDVERVEVAGTDHAALIATMVLPTPGFGDAAP